MFEEKLLSGMKGFNRFIHVLLAFALVVACAMVIWDFGIKMVTAWQEGNAAHGFFQSLGSLFILWTLSTLISAEINYIQSGRISVQVFVEVAIISIIRELIVQPVQVVTSADGAGGEFNPVHYGLLLAALLIAGVVYKLVDEPKDASGAMDA